MMPLCSISTLTHPGAVFILALLQSLVGSEGLSHDSTVRTARSCAKIELQYWVKFLC